MFNPRRSQGRFVFRVAERGWWYLLCEERRRFNNAGEGEKEGEAALSQYGLVSTVGKPSHYNQTRLKGVAWRLSWLKV